MIPSVIRYIVTQTLALDVVMIYVPLYQTISYLSMKKTVAEEKDEKPDEKVKANSSIAMKYLQSSNKNIAASNTIKPKQTKHDMRKAVISLLQYWTVYSILHSSYEILQMLPFLPSIFSPILSRISIDFLQELLFFFWIWLRYLPISNKASRGDSSKKLLNATPTMMIYSNLKPIALYFSTHVDATTSNAASSISSAIQSKIHALFDIAIFFKLLSKETKDILFTVVYDSKLLFPGFITLFMPSYFTQYGCIYIRSIVPCINTIESCETSKSIPRWLKYWVVQAFIPFLLSTIIKIPFKTHFSLLVWIYLNLPFEKYVGASFVYELLEYEFVCVGLLPSEKRDLGFDRTITFRSVAWVLARLPSSVDAEKDNASAKDNQVAPNTKDSTSNTPAAANKTTSQTTTETSTLSNKSDTASASKIIHQMNQNPNPKEKSASSASKIIPQMNQQTKKPNKGAGTNALSASEIIQQMNKKDGKVDTEAKNESLSKEDSSTEHSSQSDSNKENLE